MSAKVNDCTVYIAQLEVQINKFGFKTELLCSNAGYYNIEAHDAMLRCGIKTYIPQKSKPTQRAIYTDDFCPEKFTYNSDGNLYTCAAEKELHYSCYNQKNRIKIY